jgi:hypothetical protein
VHDSIPTLAAISLEAAVSELSRSRNGGNLGISIIHQYLPTYFEDKSEKDTIRIAVIYFIS